MEMILAFIAGLGLASIGAFFMLRSHKSSSAAALEKAVNDAARQAQADKEKDIATLTADLKNAKENLAQFKKEAEAHEKKLLAAKEEAHQAAMLEMQRHHQTALETLEQRFKDAITADKDRLDTALEALKADVKNTTTEALKQRQNEFQQTNSSSMKQIVEPLKETLQKMETALKENKSVHETSTATIKENIATLVSKAMQVSHSAERLSNALTAENKTQGCWGEQKIEALLDAMGLEKGLQYDSQEFLRDASGNVVISDETARRMQPDIILHLDATRDLIIDSKVSLRAFVEYTNAANDEERSVALAAHIKSVRNHVKELAKKNYAAYVKHPRQSVDFVMMFVPIDSALQLALLNAPSLWREAMNQGVFIVGEQNLYAALRAVDVTWTTIKQDANNKAICEAGAELMDRVGLLLKRVTALGKCLESATNAYLDVKDKSINGQKGVLCAAKKLEKLGAKPSTKHPLPSPEIDDAATLSLPMDSEEHNK
jgi:DNA recombination protein RmuC